MLDRYTKVITDQARKEGYNIVPFPKSKKMVILNKKGKEEVWLNQSLTHLTPYISFEIIKDKFLTNLYLKKHGFPVPPQKQCSSINDCKLFLKKYKKIVVKPKIGVRGRGITVGVTTFNELKKSFPEAQKVHSEVIAEKFVAGVDHRVLVIDYKKIFAAQRIAAHVVGDGEKTINQLISEKNAKPLRKRMKRQIIKDKFTRQILKEQKMAISSVPQKGQIVYLRKTANLATGGEAIDITNKLSAKIKKLSIEIAKSFQVPVVGIDYLSEDINKKPAYITELNLIPGILIHHYPDLGRSYNVAKEILKLFK